MSATKTSPSLSPAPQDNSYQLEDEITNRPEQMQPPVDHDHVTLADARRPPPAPLAHGDTGSEIFVAPRQFAPPRRTDHTYSDYATQTPSPHECPITKKSHSNFPAKLHRIISNPANSQAIAWQSHGRAWKVIDKKLLVNVVIPKYFLQTKYESFTRQLSGWGFKRLYQTGPDYQCYYHECFLRGLPHLTRLMKRVVPHQGKLVPNVEAEPKFSEMPPLSTAYAHPPPRVNLQSAPVNFQAAGANPFPCIGFAPNLTSYNALLDSPPNQDIRHHYHHHGLTAPAYNFLAQPSLDLYANPNLHQHLQHPHLQHPTHLSQHHEHSMPPYFEKENSDGSRTTRSPPQLYKLAEPAYPPNISGKQPHVVDSQHRGAENHELFLYHQDETPSVGNASENANTYGNVPDESLCPGYDGINPHAIQHGLLLYDSFLQLKPRRLSRINVPDRNETWLEDESPQHRSVHNNTYTPKPNEIGPPTMQHQHSRHDSFFHLQQQRNSHINAPDSNETRVGDPTRQPHPDTFSAFTAKPNEIEPHAIQHQHSRYDSFFHLQQQRNPHVNAPDSNETRVGDPTRQPHPDYYNPFTPNPNEIGPRAMQHQHARDDSLFHVQQEQNPHVNAQDSNQTLEDQSQQPHPGYYSPFTSNPGAIGRRAMQYQHSAYGSFFHLQQQRNPHVNELDSNVTRLEYLSQQPRASYNSHFTPNPNEIGPRAMQPHHPPYDAFLLLQQQQKQQPLHANASNNSQISLADQNRQLHPNNCSTFTPNPNEIGPLAMQHQYSPNDIFPYHPQQQPPYVNPTDNYNEIRPKQNPDQEPNTGS
ncbi:hypothetical protein ACHAW6_016180 [Cyclotella cf. meneghiniana]